MIETLNLMVKDLNILQVFLIMKIFKEKFLEEIIITLSKLIDSNLAREALSNGDKILSENYFQHADHFTRVMNEQESFKNQNLIKNSEKKDDQSNTKDDKVDLAEKEKIEAKSFAAK